MNARVTIQDAFSGGKGERSVFMYEYSDGSHGFNIEDCGIEESYHEISQQEFDHFKEIGLAEMRKEIEANISPAIKYGYGFYGCGLFLVDGVPYRMIRSGSSCD